jgi:ABC-type multidrug transport system ATPase subunit
MTGKCCKKPMAGVEPKVILDDVSGTILPGQFLAIIGASGAGKTTLLNYLSGRQISANLEKKGKILINGVDRDLVKSFSAFSAYVQ